MHALLMNHFTPIVDTHPSPVALLAAARSHSSAEIMIRIKRYADDPTNRHAAKMTKLVDFFKEHPLVQFAFIEAISLTVDLATCGGDFATVALKHAVTITGEVVKAKWETLVNAMKALKRGWTRAVNAAVVKQARAAIYNWVYEHSSPRVRALIGALHDANAADASACACFWFWVSVCRCVCAVLLSFYWCNPPPQVIGLCTCALDLFQILCVS
jgi:hypothetical protein